MDQLISDIKKAFAITFQGKARVITGLPEEFKAWIIKENHQLSVAVPIEKEYSFSESFSTISLRTDQDLKISGYDNDLLMLTCHDVAFKDEFATICADFVDPGHNGEKRRELIGDPKKWWEKWKELVGNKSVNSNPYDVLAELLVLENLLEQKMDARWSGSDYGTNDIQTNAANYEVKSTISRYGYEVTISSIYQLAKRNDNPLFLCFVRLEETSFGDTIDNVVTRLSRMGYDEVELEEHLKKRGLEKGRTSRSNTYSVLEMKQYTVDETFPSITEASFKNDTMPSGIKKITYVVDLTSLDSSNMI